MMPEIVTAPHPSQSPHSDNRRGDASWTTVMLMVTAELRSMTS